MDKRTEAIQQDIDYTHDSMTGKMEEIEGRMQGSAHNVRSSMEEGVNRTVDNVKSTVGNNFEKMKENVDIQQLVEERPWLMLGGSVLAGYMLGSLTERDSSHRHMPYERSAYPYHINRSEHDDQHDEHDHQHRYYSDEVRRTPSASRSRTNAAKAVSSNFVDDVLGQFHEELDTLKDATLATMTRVLRETLHDNLPQLAEEFEQARAERQQYHAQRSGGAHLDTPQDQERSTSIVEPTAAESDAIPSSSAVQEQRQDTATSSIVEPVQQEKR